MGGGVLGFVSRGDEEKDEDEQGVDVATEEGDSGAGEDGEDLINSSDEGKADATWFMVS